MRYVKMLLLFALMLATFSIAAATASAEETSLPSFLTLPAVENFELEASSFTALTRLIGIKNLEDEGYKFNARGTEMGELGTIHIWLLNVFLGATECRTSNDANPNVLFEAEYHLVLVLKKLANGEVHTLYGLLILVPRTLILCDTIDIFVGGTQLNDISTLGNTEVTSISGSTGACSGNTPAYTEYDNMSGGMNTGELKSELGGLKGKSCFEIEGAIIFSTVGLEPPSIELMEP